MHQMKCPGKRQDNVVYQPLKYRGIGANDAIRLMRINSVKLGIKPHMAGPV